MRWLPPCHFARALRRSLKRPLPSQYPSESRPPPYMLCIVRNNRKEVIQCLIVYRRGRRHS
jgi:hypothetical protein